MDYYPPNYPYMITSAHNLKWTHIGHRGRWAVTARVGPDLMLYVLPFIGWRGEGVRS